MWNFQFFFQWSFKEDPTFWTKNFLTYFRVFFSPVKKGFSTFGKPTIAFAQRSEVGVGSGIVFHFMTPGVQKYTYYKFIYLYVRNFVSRWPSHNSCCKKGQKWNVFECRSLHCYEAELLVICRQDSTYITVKVYWIWPSKTSREKN